MSETEPQVDEAPTVDEAGSKQKRNTTVFVIVGLFLIALIAGLMAPRGCSSSLEGNGAVIIHDNGEYLEASNEAKTLTADIFAKIDRGEPLTDLEKSDLQKSLRLYEGMLAYLPTKPVPNLTAGQASEALGDHKGAIKHYLAYLNGSTEDTSDDGKVIRADTHLLLSQSYLNSQQYKEALDEANEALKAFNGNVSYLIARASAYAQLGRKKEALDDLSEALSKDPENRRAQGLYDFLSKDREPKAKGQS